MGFVTGMIVGQMMAHHDAPPPIASAAGQTMCVIAENYAEYRLCRWPELADQLHASNRQNTLHCDYDENQKAKECDIEWRTGMEWRGILRLRGINPK